MRKTKGRGKQLSNLRSFWYTDLKPMLLRLGVPVEGRRATELVYDMVGFAAIVAVAVYVVLDLEFPPWGLIRVEAFGQALVKLLENMK